MHLSLSSRFANSRVMLLAITCIGFILTPCMAGTFTLDNSHTQIGFSVKHLMISNVKGKFTEYEGSFKYNPQDLANASLTITIEANSIDTGNEKRDDHLRGPDFFEVEKYQQIHFQSTAIKKTDAGAAITGDLTMHGITKSVTLPCAITEIIKDPWGNKRFGLSATFTINRQDWNINFSKTMDNGGLVVGNEVQCELDAEFTKPAE